MHGGGVFHSTHQHRASDSNLHHGHATAVPFRHGGIAQSAALGITFLHDIWVGRLCCFIVILWRSCSHPRRPIPHSPFFFFLSGSLSPVLIIKTWRSRRKLIRQGFGGHSKIMTSFCYGCLRMGCIYKVPRKRRGGGWDWCMDRGGLFHTLLCWPLSLFSFSADTFGFGPTWRRMTD